jgi:iron complex outermembrane receptor protein
MEWQAGYKTGVNEQRDLHGELDYFTPEDIHADDIYIQSKVTLDVAPNQTSHIQMYSQKFIRETAWSACLTQDAADDLTGGSIICGDFNKDLTETKSEIEFQHTSIWNKALRTVAGLRVRLDEFESETYNGGYSDNVNNSAFTNIEYRINDSLLINAGGMYEKDDLNGEYFSPRIALNTHITQLDTIRFIYSEAIRSPDLYEQGGQWIFDVKNAYVFGGAIYGNQLFPVGTVESDLDFEKIYSTEISYFGMFPSIGAQLDLKIFTDKLTGLISEGLGHDVELTNRNKLRQQGIEGQFKVKLSSNDNLAISFSYTDTKDDYFVNLNTAEDVAEANNTNYLDTSDIGVTLNKGAQRETSLSAEQSGSLSWIHSFNTNTVLGTAYYHVENWNPYADAEYNGTGDVSGYTFSRLDMNIRHKIPLTGDLALTLQAAMQYRFDDDPLGRSRNNYVDDHFLYGSAQVNF